MDADVVGDKPLGNRDEGAADNGHDQDAGAVAGQRSELRHPQREDAGEHDGVEEPDQDDAPHGQLARAEHRDRNQYTGRDRANAQQNAGLRLGTAAAECSEDGDGRRGNGDHYEQRASGDHDIP